MVEQAAPGHHLYQCVCCHGLQAPFAIINYMEVHNSVVKAFSLSDERLEQMANELSEDAYWNAYARLIIDDQNRSPSPDEAGA